MTALLFPNEEALRVALTSGLVPAQVQAASAGVVRLADGAVRMFPSVTLPDAAATSLRSAGVQFDAMRASDASQVSCWAQAIAPRWLGEPDEVPGLVLFSVPRGESALELAGELLRLGCDRQEYRFTPDGAWVRVVQPPYYTVARILDRSTGARAFVPSPAGQDRVWTQLGFAHPLAQQTKAGQGELVLIHGDGQWTRLADERWTDIYQLIDLAVPAAPVSYATTTPSARLTVTLRLAHAARQASPSLWVLRNDAARELDAIVANLPDTVLDRLLFAAAGDVVILRAHPGVDAPPELVVAAEAYALLAGFQNLFLPGGRIVEPPLRRDRLRDLLAPDAERLFWLAPQDGTAFRVESIAQTAFNPLSEWVDYVVHSNASALEPWVRSAVFEFERFESIGGEWGAAPAPLKEAEPEKQEPSRTRQRAAAPAEPAPVKATRPKSVAPPPPEQTVLPTFSAADEEQRLAATERRFIESTAPADDASRHELWLAMAQIHTRLKHGREAGLCWTRTVWEVEPDEAEPWLRRWAESEAHLVGVPVEKLHGHVLARTTPSRDETRALAAYVAWSPQALDTHAAQVWLDAHDENLDVRSLWLARAALARAAGGDQLGLTKAHDRVLGRLQRGLSLERDVPAFLRFSSHASRDTAGADQLVAGLEALFRRYETTKRKRHVVEAPAELTNAYVQFVFAFGFARLGQADRAKALRTAAATVLQKRGAVHEFLVRAFTARMEQALEGLPPETPLPSALEADLSRFDKDERYAIDQLRRFSSVLEPHESLDPISAYYRNEADPRGAEFAGLRGLSDAQRLGDEIERLTGVALRASGADRRRLFEGIVDFLPALPEARAVTQLQLLARALAPFDVRTRAVIAEKLLLMASHFAAGGAPRPVVQELIALVPQLPPEGVTELAGVMSRCLRSLRRLNMREVAATLIEALLARVPATDLSARVSLAGGLASIGAMEAAVPAFDAALTAIRREMKATTEVVPRCALVRAYCVAVSQTNPSFALTRIPPVADTLVDITEFMTSKYFCPPVVNFMESLVLGLASEELELGESGRRWLDDDEYLVRRRVHRELREQL